MFDSEREVGALLEGRITRKEFILRGIGAGLSLTAIGSLLEACSPSGGTSGQSSPPATPTGTLTFGNAEPPTANYWDPAASFGLVDEQVASLVHDTLLAYNSQGQLINQLATKADRSSNTKMHVELRKGVNFQDGTPLTSKDVKATYDRLGAPDSKLGRSSEVSPLHVDTIDDHTLDIVTDRPFGPLEKAMAQLPILPISDINNPDNFKSRALGAGPYKFVSYSGNRVTLAANPNYWRGAPHIKTVNFDYIEDQSARLNALLTGQIDIMTRTSSIQLERVKGNNKFYTTNVSPPSMVMQLWQHNGPLKDLKVRQALAYGIDRQSIAKNILGGVDPVGFSSLPSDTPLYKPLDDKFAYDPNKAKALLAEAGHASGLVLTMATGSAVPHQPEVDQFIAQQLKQIGIDVTITQLEVGKLRTSYNQYDLALATLTTFTNDADQYLAFFTGGVADFVWHLRDSTIDPLVQAQREAVGSARQDAVTACAKYLWEQQESLFLADEVWYSIVNSRVKNYQRVQLVGEPLVNQAWVTS